MFKNEFWNQIVKRKIENSIRVLEMTSKEEFPISKLTEYINEITDGDSKNREGLAAKMYFRSLFGSIEKSFRRILCTIRLL